MHSEKLKIIVLNATIMCNDIYLALKCFPIELCFPNLHPPSSPGTHTQITLRMLRMYVVTIISLIVSSLLMQVLARVIYQE
jgi:hypothetical protein